MDMKKKGNGLNQNGKQVLSHSKKKSKGQKAADWLAKWAGSWSFIGIFMLFLLAYLQQNHFV